MSKGAGGLAADGFGGSPTAVAQAVGFLKTLSHEGRLQILCLLLDRNLSVKELSGSLQMAQPTTSQLLMRLRSEGYVDARRQGKTVIYHLVRQDVMPVIKSLRDAFCAPEAARPSPGRS